MVPKILYHQNPHSKSVDFQTNCRTWVRNAASDIRQHRLNWSDWPDDWLFYDSRFNLLRASNETFLRFLCETIHPVVRPDLVEACEMAAIYSNELKADGWRIVEGKQISGRPIFVAERIHGRTDIFEEPTGWQKVDRQLQEVRMCLDTADSEEECQAVGLLCREVLISVGQAVFDPNKHKSLDGVIPSSTICSGKQSGLLFRVLTRLNR